MIFYKSIVLTELKIVNYYVYVVVYGYFFLLEIGRRI